MNSPALQAGRSSTLGRLALGTSAVLLALVGYQACVTPSLGASRAAMAAEKLSNEQMERFQIPMPRGAAAAEDVLGPGDSAPGVEEDRAGPEDIGAAAPVPRSGAAPSVAARVEPTPAPAPTPGKAALGSGAAFFVQLAALTDEAAVERAWDLFQREHGEILGELSRRVERFETDRGLLFHRMMVGPFANRAAAAEVCRALQERQQDCFLHGPA